MLIYTSISIHNSCTMYLHHYIFYTTNQDHTVLLLKTCDRDDKKEICVYSLRDVILRCVLGMPGKWGGMKRSNRSRASRCACCSTRWSSSSARRLGGGGNESGRSRSRGSSLGIADEIGGGGSGGSSGGPPTDGGCDDDDDDEDEGVEVFGEVVGAIDVPADDVMVR